MILVDVNVLVAMAWHEHEHHDVASTWFRSMETGTEAYGSPSLVWHAVVRLATNRRMVDPPLSLGEIFSFRDRLALGRGYRSIEPGRRHMAIFRDVCEQSEARGNLITDAAIAAIAIENGAGVASFDRDFARFRGLRWSIPGDEG